MVDSDELRAHLKTMPKQVPRALQVQEEEESSSSSSSGQSLVTLVVGQHRAVLRVATIFVVTPSPLTPLCVLVAVRRVTDVSVGTRRR